MGMFQDIWRIHKIVTRPNITEQLCHMFLANTGR